MDCNQREWRNEEVFFSSKVTPKYDIFAISQGHMTKLEEVEGKVDGMATADNCPPRQQQVTITLAREMNGWLK